MKKTILPVLAAVFGAVLASAAQDIRPAVFAGQFYDKDPGRLSAELDAYLAEARPAAPLSGRILGLVAPHAGYVWSGRTAAWAYALVKGGPFDTVVVIGPSHKVGFEGCSIWPRGGFETPLGVAEVDAELARAISKASGFGFRPEAFAEEHSVEVQIPFIQKVLPGARIVPIVMGYQTKPTIDALTAGLVRACSGKKVLVVASTDLSHYLPRAQADATDARTLALLKSLKTGTLIREVEQGQNVMCGGGPVAACLLYAEKAGPVSFEVLKHTNSSESGGPSDQTVGYAAAAIVSGESREAGPFSLTAEEKKTLLGLARSAVEEFVGRGVTVADRTGNAKFREPRGVFVTLTERGNLRGCIGFIEPVAPLGDALVQAAIYAASEDRRFLPVRPEELRDLKVEVSVLTPLSDLSNPMAVVVGRHGLVIEKGDRRGLLLPQVATDNGWDRETFLEQACLKAGLPSDAWRKGARVSVFEAIVFHE
jgi:AmmeMemoRadiSam system protein B/AmmeMemoRadiSam system protein A